jgi:hypothetical protein
MDHVQRAVKKSCPAAARIFQGNLGGLGNGRHTAVATVADTPV